MLLSTPTDPSLLSFNGSAIIVLINLLILYFFMKKFLISKINDVLEKRANNIRESLKEAENAKKTAKEITATYESKLKEASKEAQVILDESRKKAQREANQIIADATQEAQEIIAKAKEDMAMEQREIVKKVRRDVSTLALCAASKIMEENMDTSKNKDLVEAFLAKEGVA
jgi:F-type H+-transporting ATPase subunit b